MVTAVDANASYFAKWDNAIVTCRTYGHEWPVAVPGRRLPRGFTAVANAHDGSYQLRQECKRCHTVRIRTTLPGGYLYDKSAHYSYTYPDNFPHVPGTDEISRADIVNEYWRRIMEPGSE